jgi:hypothetical protein
MNLLCLNTLTQQERESLATALDDLALATAINIASQLFQQIAFNFWTGRFGIFRLT